MELTAERASISRTTLSKIEKGDPAVSLGNYASVLFVLGLMGNLANVLDLKNDDLGHALEDEHLPKRIRYPKEAPGE